MILSNKQLFVSQNQGYAHFIWNEDNMEAKYKTMLLKVLSL